MSLNKQCTTNNCHANYVAHQSVQTFIGKTLEQKYTNAFSPAVQMSSLLSFKKILAISDKSVPFINIFSVVHFSMPNGRDASYPVIPSKNRSDEILKKQTYVVCSRVSSYYVFLQQMFVRDSFSTVSQQNKHISFFTNIQHQFELLHILLPYEQRISLYLFLYRALLSLHFPKLNQAAP